MTVESAMTAIIGVTPTQKELLIFRRQIFNAVMPLPCREEMRVRRVNMGSFEKHKSVVLPIMKSQQVCAQMLNITVANRQEYEQKAILMNLFHI
jgi:hypothetical protein